MIGVRRYKFTGVKRALIANSSKGLVRKPALTLDLDELNSLSVQNEQYQTHDGEDYRHSAPRPPTGGWLVSPQPIIAQTQTRKDARENGEQDGDKPGGHVSGSCSLSSL